MNASKIKQSRKPPSSLFAQQNLPNLSLALTPYGFACIIIAIGIVFIPLGTSLLSKSNNVFQQRIVYDGDGADLNCSVAFQNEGIQCQAKFILDEDVTGPMYVYYQLEHFYQNHRRYFQSKSILQLGGQNLAQGAAELDCSPLLLTNNGSLLLNPCGLVANSFFTDQFVLTNSTQSWFMDETNIALASDKNHLYKQVAGFQYVPVTDSSVTCSASSLPEGCQNYYDKTTDQYYNYYYPDDNTVQYLHETYPNQISPIEGVTNEHFIVWMKTSGLPTFRKLYGKVNGKFYKGDELVFNITANYEVASYGASKALIITNLGGYGGQNPYSGIAYIVSGVLAMSLGLFFGCREYFKF